MTSTKRVDARGHRKCPIATTQKSLMSKLVRASHRDLDVTGLVFFTQLDWWSTGIVEIGVRVPSRSEFSGLSRYRLKLKRYTGMYTFVSIPSSSAWIKWTDFGWFMYGGPQGHAANQKVAANKIKLQQIWNSCCKFSKNSLSWILFTHVKPVKYNYVKFKRQWKSTFISIFLNKKLRNMKRQIFSHKLLLKEKSLNVLLQPFYRVLLFFFFFRYSKLYHHAN